MNKDDIKEKISDLKQAETHFEGACVAGSNPVQKLAKGLLILTRILLKDLEKIEFRND